METRQIPCAIEQVPVCIADGDVCSKESLLVVGIQSLDLATFTKPRFYEPATLVDVT